MENLKIKVTRINNRYHARLLNHKLEVLDEMACDLKCDIGYICHELMRWFHKMGGDSIYAEKTRHRRNYNNPKGNVYYLPYLENENKKRSSSV